MFCAFTLSTGRCGTMTLARVLNQHPQIIALHEPFPRLIRISARAYLEPDSELMELIIKIAREDYIEASNQKGCIYVETANRLTFFSYAIRKAFPQAKFIHLVRHPVRVIKSGIRRRWYCGHPWDAGRIFPKSMHCDGRLWTELSPSEKVAWNWVETNRFIFDFLQGIPEKQKFFLRLEEIDSRISSIWDFLGVRPFGVRIGKLNQGSQHEVREDFIPFLKKIGQDVVKNCGYEIEGVQ